MTDTDRDRTLVHRLREAIEGKGIYKAFLMDAIEEAIDRVLRLEKERDEARRMYCGRVSRDVPLDAFDIAKNHGWDCFPQEDEPCSVTPAP
jgi:hypothetical protein